MMRLGLYNREILLLVLVLIVAALLRFWALDRIPAGLYFDEAADALDALITLRTGNWPAFYESQGGKEALWMWLQAGVFSVAGVGVLQIRLLAAVVGLLTVAAVWWAARELFLTDQDESASEMALLAAAVLATLFVHVHFSRDNYRLLSQPFVGSLAIAVLWRGLRGHRRGWFLAGGALLGLSMYTYSAARFYVVLLVLFFGLEWLLARSRNEALLRRNFIRLVGLGLIALIVFAPMGLYFVNHPDLLSQRSDEVSFLNPTWNQGRPWAALFDSTWRNLAGLIWYGTENTHWNIPGRPLLDGLTIPLFLLGVMVALRRWRRPVYLFLLLWLLILYLPAILSYDRVPIFHRAQGATPAVVILAALGGWTAWQWLSQRLGPKLPQGWNVAPLFSILVVSGAITGYDYFARWAPSWVAYQATQPYFLELIEQMNNEPEPEAVYLFPYDVRNGRYEHPALQLFYHGTSPYFSITDHEGRILAALTEATAGREVVRLVDWKVGRSVEADPKRLIPTLLTMYGQPLAGITETPAYRIESFRLAGPAINFRSFPKVQWVDLPAGAGLTLRAYAFGPTGQPVLTVGNPLPVGNPVWVLLQWQAAGPTPADYKVSVRLVDGTKVLAQQDKLLFNGFHLGTRQWHPGEVNMDLYLLPLTQAGRFGLQVIVYDEATNQALMPAGLILPAWVEVAQP